ncbi:hypothetical protein DEF93_01850, partial [Streptococcus agalactiae]
ISRPIVITIVKEKTSWINIPVCLQSETSWRYLQLVFMFLKGCSLALLNKITVINNLVYSVR